MGEENETKGRLALERNFEKAFKLVHSFSGTVQNTIAESLPIVQGVANLMEQRECCVAVDYSTLPFAAAFPDLKERLMSKIKDEIAERVGKLENMIEVLKEKQEMTSKHCETSWNLVHKYSASLDFASVCASSSTCFSLADMMEWLETLNTLLYQQYWGQVHLLQLVMRGEEVMSDNLVQKWTDQDDVLINTIKDILMKVELFVGEKR